MIAPLTADELRALDMLANLPVLPDAPLDILNRVDEIEYSRRLVSSEREWQKSKARELSHATCDAFFAEHPEAATRAWTLAPYTDRQRESITRALAEIGESDRLDHVIAVRLRAVEIQSLLRADRAQHEAA